MADIRMKTRTNFGNCSSQVVARGIDLLSYLGWPLRSAGGRLAVVMTGGPGVVPGQNRHPGPNAGLHVCLGRGVGI